MRDLVVIATAAVGVFSTLGCGDDETSRSRQPSDPANSGTNGLAEPIDTSGAGGSDPGASGSGAGGVVAGATSAGAGGAGTGGSAGTLNAPVCPVWPPVEPARATGCGDAVLSPPEQCDDGNDVEGDACGNSCTWQPSAAIANGSTTTGAEQSTGNGQHGLAESCGRIALVVSQRAEQRTTLYGSIFTPDGARIVTDLDLAAGRIPAASPNPAIAGLPDGGFAVAWSDLTDGSLDVVLRRITADGVALPNAVVANETVAGAQFDADLIWTGTALVAAWTDAGGVKARAFSYDLTPLGDEVTVGEGAALSGSPALTTFADSWAVAFRSYDAGAEHLQVHAGGLAWTVGPIAPGPAGDRPALIAIDGQRLLLVFTHSVDPLGTGTANVARIAAAVLDTESVGPTEWFALEPLLPENAAAEARSQTRPSAVRLNDGRVAIAWEYEAALGAFGRSTWVTLIGGLGGGVLSISEEQRLIPGDYGSKPRLLRAPTGQTFITWEDSSTLRGRWPMPQAMYTVWPGSIAAPAPDRG